MQERNAEKRGTVRYGIKAGGEEYKKLKPILAAREREREERTNPEDKKTEEGMRAMEVGEYPEEKETRHSEERRKEVGRGGIGRRVAVTYLLPTRYPWNPCNPSNPWNPCNPWNPWNGRRKR